MHKKVVIRGVILLLAGLCLVVCYFFFKADNGRVNYTNKQLGIEISGKVSALIADDSLAQACWYPQNQEATTSKVFSWLNGAKPYEGKIPEPDYSTQPVYSGNRGPAYFVISWDKCTIIFEPANYLFKENENYVVKYIENVVKIKNNEKENYIESQQLYKWLKNDEWKAEFTDEMTKEIMDKLPK
ncbi:MAG: hypothetical protein Q8930_09395 [Bacillota bacterium]|nr:hypothetical protein [Bacillota bacterium]